MIDITAIVNALMGLIAVLITMYLIPWIKNRTTEAQREELQAWVKIACAAAEQLCKAGKIADKKQYVLDFLTQKNCKIELPELEQLIEATVLEINKKWNTTN